MSKQEVHSVLNTGATLRKLRLYSPVPTDLVVPWALLTVRACVFVHAADFSNYSAWHYRTLLLPRLHNEDINTGGRGGPGTDPGSARADAALEHAAGHSQSCWAQLACVLYAVVPHA